MSAPWLECRNITVRFDGVAALENVDFAVYPGEIHGLVGCNGAGKSTLMKVLAGAVAHYEGTIRLDGAPIRLDSPRASLRHGIAMVYQELSGIGQLSVAENLCLGRQPVTPWGTIAWRTMIRQAEAALAELEIAVDVRRKLAEYPLVVRQMVEIARGLHSGARLLILDEPTSALSIPEARRLFELMRRLKVRGVAQVFISHFLEDVLAICDRVTILRDGRRIATHPVADVTRRSLIEAMVGRGVDATGQDHLEAVLPEVSAGPVRLRVDHLRSAGAFEDVSLEVRAGECVGLYGFVGAGHQDLAQAIAGARPVEGGVVTVDGAALRRGDVGEAVARGVLLVPADRGRSVVRQATIGQNVSLAHLRRAVGEWLTRRREMEAVQPVLNRVGCRPPNPRMRAGLLSGGNQQKVVLAKWLLGPVRVLVLEEPTRGMDVHAKREVMELVQQQKGAGAAVVLASTEPELLLAYADRIVVFSRGRVTRTFAGERVTKADLMHAAEEGLEAPAGKAL
jgi:ribose transport system ATP-binding protein